MSFPVVRASLVFSVLCPLLFSLFAFVFGFGFFFLAGWHSLPQAVCEAPETSGRTLLTVKLSPPRSRR